MKKTMKKLVLAKETVRNLDATGLGKAAGGGAYTLLYGDCGTFYCGPTSSSPNGCAYACIEG